MVIISSWNWVADDDRQESKHIGMVFWDAIGINIELRIRLLGLERKRIGTTTLANEATTTTSIRGFFRLRTTLSLLACTTTRGFFFYTITTGFFAINTNFSLRLWFNISSLLTYTRARFFFPVTNTMCAFILGPPPQSF